MIGLDSNILVRFFTHDDPDQTAVAVDIIENRLSIDEPGFVSLIVLAETSWVLRRRYHYSWREVGGALKALAQLSAVRLESEREAFTAISAAAEDGAELADMLIAALARKAGCSVTLTFDEGAARLPGFQLAT